MYPLYKDMLLNEAQQQLVLDYVREVDFHLPGASSTDFEVVPLAKYVGWNFKSEDLESFAVGLRCTKPGFERHHTFIRMSRGQLLAQADAPRLPVNDPVLANDTLRMQRWRETPTGPKRTGIDSYATTDGTIAGVEMDLQQLEDTLSDIEAFAAAGKGVGNEGQFDLAVDWGTLLAGRYPRLGYYAKREQLSAEQAARLQRFEQRAKQAEPLLRELQLPTLTCLATPEKRRHAQHHS
ncbi:MAG: hypothetical protein Q4Q03_04420 [Bowdeniella nasicola]|nr:hypothetical protein [Bowdeniella nasicola]